MQYVRENPWVNQGLSVGGLKWAISAMYASNWHPLTWISHMADCSLWGLNPGGHHLTNVILHSLNAALLFFLLHRLTRRLWPSWLTAALFAWHPLHVESVAWIAERKDVLSTLFLFLTIWAYAEYVRHGAIYRYVLALALFAAGLLCKPMIVTLPCLLLLLDYWPLQRLQPSAETGGRRSMFCLILEKLPFFALSLAASIMTILAQRSGGAIKTFDQVSLLMRLVNSAAAYGWYVTKTIVPTGLCVFHSMPSSPAYAAAIGSLLLIAGIAWLAVRMRVQHPWILVGWFWFLGTLIPVIGIIQVGHQAVADRYTYVSLIGLFIILSWGLDLWIKIRPSLRSWAIGLAAVSLLLCIVETRAQLTSWQNGIALFTRILAADGNSAFAQNGLAAALSDAGRGREAIPHYEEVLRLLPDLGPTHAKLGIEFVNIGDLNHASEQFSAALKLSPNDESLHNNLGVVLAREGQLERAVEQFKAAIQCNPTYPESYLNYARALEREGQYGLAVTNYYLALERDTNSPETLNGLAHLLATCPQPKWNNPSAAVALAERANALTRFQVCPYIATLAAAYAAIGEYSKAVENADLARRLATVQGLQDLAAKIESELESYKARQKSEIRRDMPVK
jgi:tetratricopeptide (TPR) repeat protein